LPQHADYKYSNQRNIYSIRRQWNIVATKVDEQQLDLYMDKQFELQVQHSADEEDDEDDDWQTFSGWNSTQSTRDGTDVSCDNTKDTSSESEAETVDSAPQQTDFGYNPFKPTTPEQSKDAVEDFPDPELALDILDSEDEEQSQYTDESHDEYAQYSLNEPVLATPFLKKISTEAVRFEEDSEAMDSWAQDDDSFTFSRSSSGAGVTCDPARIALRMHMPNKFVVSSASDSFDSVPPPPPPPTAGSPPRTPPRTPTGHYPRAAPLVTPPRDSPPRSPPRQPTLNNAPQSPPRISPSRKLMLRSRRLTSPPEEEKKLVSSTVATNRAIVIGSRKQALQKAKKHFQEQEEPNSPPSPVRRRSVFRSPNRKAAQPVGPISPERQRHYSTFSMKRFSP